MKTLPYFLIVLLFLPLTTDAFPVCTENAELEGNTMTIEEFLNTPKKELKKKLNRKLTLKENIGRWVMKRSLKKAIRKNPRLGETSFGAFFGGREYTAGNHTQTVPEEDNRSATLAIAAFISALLLPFVGGVICIIALIVINKNPDKFKGEGWAWAGIVYTLLITAGLIIIASLL